MICDLQAVKETSKTKADTKKVAATRTTEDQNNEANNQMLMVLNAIEKHLRCCRFFCGDSD